MALQLAALGTASFSFVQVLGTVSPALPARGDEAAGLFYGLVWVVSLHELFGTRRRRTPRSKGSPPIRR